jgi:SecA DEAD-like domain
MGVRHLRRTCVRRTGKESTWLGLSVVAIDFPVQYCLRLVREPTTILQGHTCCRIGKVFSWLGLSVAAVTTEDRRFGDVAVRREKFGADITYVTGQELAFTWMFDNTSSCRKPDQQVP